MKTEKKKVIKDTKRLFVKKGPCSSAFFHILNRQFGNALETEERAAEPLAGGIMQHGHQCGMLWGASLAVGAESFRRNSDHAKAIGVAITATQHLVDSFSTRAKTLDCSDITDTDWSSKFGMVKYFFTGKIVSCFKLAERWAPEAIESATQGLSSGQTNLPELPVSCASEVAKKMGATDEEMVIVAGFSGGLGLSGKACGALSAAIWMQTLGLYKKQTGKSYYSNAESQNTLKAFFAETDHEFLCENISGQCFKSVDDHSEFIKKGGCQKLIDILAEA
ncbi:MAG: C-GCAxxG-C-C family protein [Leptospirales bacterium]